jgi:hypothetical protein
VSQMPLQAQTSSPYADLTEAACAWLGVQQLDRQAMKLRLKPKLVLRLTVPLKVQKQIDAAATTATGMPWAAE